MRSLPPDVQAGPRLDILTCIHENPGVHLRSVQRRTDLPLGQVLYHLDRLERMGLVASSRDRGFRRYYRVGEVSRDEKPVLAALRHRVPRRAIVVLLASPGLTHGELQRELGIAGSTLSFHLARLVASGILEQDDSRRYVVRDADIAAREVVEYRDSFADPFVDAYAGQLVAATPLAGS